MKIKVNLLVSTMIGLILISLFSSTYGQVSLEASSVGSGGTNSTSTGFKMISSIGQLAGFLQSSGFQLFAGFIPQLQGGNVIPAGLFSGVTVAVGSDGEFIIQSGGSGSIDFTRLFSLIDEGGGLRSITTDRDFSFTDGGSLGGSVLIPAGVKITSGAVGWGGDFLTPIARAVTSVTPPLGTTTHVIRVGLTNIDFSLDKPIKITFTGRALQNAGTVNTAGTVTEITTICNADDFTTVNAQLGAGQACKINTNNNLVIWTRYLSEFFSFDPTLRPGGSEEGIRSMPSFTQGFLADEFPLVIGDTKFSDLSDFSKPFPTVTLKKGIETPVTLLLWEINGPQYIDHVAIYIAPSKLYDVQSSKAWLAYNKGKGTDKYDPNGFFENAYASTSVKGGKFQITFYITFAKPLEASDIVIRSWNIDRNGISVLVPKALAVIEDESSIAKEEQPPALPEKPVEPKIEMTPEPGVDIVPEPGVDIMTPTQKETIQKWAGFHIVSASDAELLKALNIELPSDSKTPQKLPKWTKNPLAKWTLDGKVSMKEFYNAVNYLVKKRI